MKRNSFKQIFLVTLAICAVLITGCKKDDPVKVSSITLDKKDITLVVGETLLLHATVQPSDAENSDIAWQSDNTAVATVSKTGEVTAVSVGQAKVTATAGGLSASCTVTVEPKIVPAESITLDQTALTLKFGETATLTATVMPVDCTDQVVWSSDKPEVCQVDDQGVVKVVSAGSAVIKATAGTVSAECTVEIKPQVYFTGSLTGNTAVYWYNGEMKELSDAGIAAIPNDIYVSASGDIYIVGYDTTESGKAKAAFWKNGQISYLSDGTKDVQALSVFVHGNDVYVAGHEVSTKNKVFLWKNGTAQVLPSTHNYAEARSVTVASDGTTYVAGYDNGPVLWINGVKSPTISGDPAASLTSVYLYGGKPYFSGYMTDASYTVRPLAFIDNKQSPLTDGGADEDCYANAIYVDDKANVHVVGNQATGTKKALWWKNGALQTLPAGNYKAFDVAGFGDQLIIAGTIGEKVGFQTVTKATYWQDGKAYPLSSDKSDARAVFIRTR